MTVQRMEVPAALDGERVDRVVSFVTGLARAEAAALVDAGGVVVRGRPVTTKSKKVAAGDTLEIDMPSPVPPPGGQSDVDVAIVHSDDAVIVVDKPAGLVVHPGAGNPDRTLVNGLIARFPDLDQAAWPDRSRPGIVHRLDKGTSGLLMVARTPESLVALAGQLEQRSVERRYLALVWGAIEEPDGIVDAPVGRSANDPTRMAVRADGRRAVTRYQVLDRWTDPQPATLVRCTLDTGRTHQIRVHLTAIGHPIVGDDRYRRRGASVAPGMRPGRPFLHAAVLGFDHPISGERLRFESPLPADLQRVLDTLSR
jgi:23S rRNA pseudouridine1911/1915/1917 synthase